MFVCQKTVTLVKQNRFIHLFNLVNNNFAVSKLLSYPSILPRRKMQHSHSTIQTGGILIVGVAEKQKIYKAVFRQYMSVKSNRFGFALLRLINQSEVKPNPIVTYSHVFSRALRRLQYLLRVLIGSLDCLLLL